MDKKEKKKGKPGDPDEFGYVTDEGNTDDEYFSDTDGEDSEGRKKPIRIRMYCKHTHYEVVKEAGKVFAEFHLTKKERSDWDLAWFDGPSPGYLIDLIKGMHNHQRTNHFPGIYNLARKNMLGRHLMKMKKLLPDDYNFFPTTYMLPHDYNDFREDSKNSKYPSTFIVKPEDSCQGKGIYLTKYWESIKPTDQMVVQKYMQKPHLIDGFKYDLRIYVFVNGINPLRVYVYKDGLARFATTPYAKPTEKNIDNLFMHLTNYAINKESENYVQNEGGPNGESGSKRSYQSIIDLVETNFGTPAAEMVQKGINDIIIKSICMVQPHVNHLVRSSQPDDIENQMIFQVLGFDVMLDSKLRPSLIEVNQMPSFATDSSLDYKVKRGLITDCLKTLCLSMKRRNQYKKERRKKMDERLMVKPNQDNNDKKDENDLKKDQSGQKKQENEGLSQKQILRQAKQDAIKKEKQQRSIQREKAEAVVCNDLILIYPPVSYDHEYKIEALYPSCEKKLKDIIDTKRQAALDKVKGDRATMNFNIQKDVYDSITNKKPVKNYMQELDTHIYNSKGERIEPDEQTPDQLADIDYKNHVYELVFQHLEIQLREEYKKKVAEQKAKANLPKPPKQSIQIKKKKKQVDEYGEEIEDEDEEDEDELESEEDDEEDMDEMGLQNYDIRDEWLTQQKYVKYMEQANFLWDQFTSGNTQQKLKKIREQEELEEKIRKEEKERKAQQRLQNQKKFKIAQKERQNKEEEIYQMFKAEMDESAESESDKEESHITKGTNSKNNNSRNKSNSRVKENRSSRMVEKSYLSDRENYYTHEPESPKQPSAKQRLKLIGESEASIFKHAVHQTVSPKKQMQQTTLNLSMNNYAFSNNKQYPASQISEMKTKESMSITKQSYNLPQLSSPLKLKRDMEQQMMPNNSYGSPSHISHYMAPTIKKLKHVDYYKHMKEKYQMKRALAEQEQKQIQSILAKQTHNLQLDILMRQADLMQEQSENQSTNQKQRIKKGTRSITQTNGNNKQQNAARSRLLHQQNTDAQGLGSLIVTKGRQNMSKLSSAETQMLMHTSQSNQTSDFPNASTPVQNKSSVSQMVSNPVSPKNYKNNMSVQMSSNLPYLYRNDANLLEFNDIRSRDKSQNFSNFTQKRATIAGTQVLQPGQLSGNQHQYGLTLNQFELIEKHSNKFKSPVVKSNIKLQNLESKKQFQPQSITKLQDFTTIYGKGAFQQQKQSLV